MACLNSDQSIAVMSGNVGCWCGRRGSLVSVCVSRIMSAIRSVHYMESAKFECTFVTSHCCFSLVR